MQSTLFTRGYPSHLAFPFADFRWKSFHIQNKKDIVMKQIIYSGIVSSSGNGGFYSPGQTVGSISLLPTDTTKHYQTVFVRTSDAAHCVDLFPKMQVTLQADGTVASLETDVIAIDKNGEEHSMEEMVAQIAPPTPKAVAPTQPQDSDGSEAPA